MAEFINTSVLVGDDALVDSIIEGTITEYKDNRVIQTGYYTFWYCTALETVVMPNVTFLDRYTFKSCTALKMVDLSSVTRIEHYAFENCSALLALIIRNDAVCVLRNAAVFNSSAIANGTGYIYVPRVLVDPYKSATNWSTYAAQFRDLESFTVDGTTTGELDETKI